MKQHRQQSSGPSQRQLRVGELIRRELANLLARGDHHDPDLEGVLVSVSEVRTSPDLRVANVLVYPHGRPADAVLPALNRIKPQLRQSLNRHLALKFSPELRFELDRSFDYAEATLAKIAALNPASDDED